MNNSQLFKAAHTMTKQVIKQGDNYRVTFGLCLKAIKAEQAAAQAVSIYLTAITFVILVLVKINAVLDIDNTFALDAVFMGILSGMGLLSALHLVNVFTLLFSGHFLI